MVAPALTRECSLAPAWHLTQGDCLDVMAAMPAESVDAVVTDPPYGLAFMGKAWDRGIPGAPFWAEALRVAKPGAHLLACGGTRTFHRLTCAIEDAGWEIRDCLSWLYGTGFPKSRNGAWGGTALKPAWEPIILARKPLVGTVEANHAIHGVGALNIDGCRIGETKRVPGSLSSVSLAGFGEREGRVGQFDGDSGHNPNIGRWPANVALDEEAAALLGDPSRFFYTAKASRSEREDGLDGGIVLENAGKRTLSGGADTRGRPETRVRNTHPTVKPVALMRWLVRLVVPVGATVLDPFMGSGTTGVACENEGMRFHGIDKEREYVEIAAGRLSAARRTVKA